MGAWGTGILQNDTTLDIWTDFKERYNDGLSIKEIRQQLEDEYKPERDYEYYSDIWTGIAYGQWMCGGLEEYTLQKLTSATNDKSLTLWAEDKKLLEKRLKSLTEFVAKIQTPRPSPLKRKKIVVRRTFFQAGDVISIAVSPGEYTAAIVTKQKDHGNDGENTIVFTDCLLSKPATLEAVLRANIFYLDIGGLKNYHSGYFRAIFTARNMAKRIKIASKIGELEQQEYLNLGVATPFGDWNEIDILYKEQIAFLRNNVSQRPLNVSVQDFLTQDDEVEKVLVEWDKKLFRERLNPQNAV